MPRNTSENRDPAAVARGRLIKTERVRQGMTQQTLANLVTARLATTSPDATLTRGHLARIETGRSGMSEQKMRAIAAVLGIREADLRLPFLADLEVAA